MSGADLFEDGFPHSTPDGYRQGCRGSACPGKLERGLSCSEARTRYAGDYTYRKRVDEGMSADDIATLDAEEREVAEAVEAEEKRAQRRKVPAPVPTPEVVPAPAKAPERRKVDAAEVERHAEKQGVSLSDAARYFEREGFDVADAVEAQPSPAHSGLVHGTPYGYTRGCRNGLECPRGENGLTCSEAYRAYHRDYAARRKENGGKVLGSTRGLRKGDRVAVDGTEARAASTPPDVATQADISAPETDTSASHTDTMTAKLAARDARIAELEQQLIAARAAAWSTLIESAGVGATVLRVEVLARTS